MHFYASNSLKSILQVRTEKNVSMSTRPKASLKTGLKGNFLFGIVIETTE